MFQELSTRPVFVHDATAQFDIVPGKMGKFLAVADCMSFWPLLKEHDYWKGCCLSFAEFIPSLLVLPSGARNMVIPGARSSKQVPLFINLRFYHKRRKRKGYSLLFFRVKYTRMLSTGRVPRGEIAEMHSILARQIKQDTWKKNKQMGRL